MRTKIYNGRARTAVATMVATFACGAASASTDWEVGDVVIGVSSGQYDIYTNAGVFKETIDDTQGGFTTGCSFNPDLSQLYTTNFSTTTVTIFDVPQPHAIAGTIDTNATSPGGRSESIVFDASGDFYVGHPDGNRLIHNYNADGTLDVTFDVVALGGGIDRRGTDWLDVSADQQIIFYTSEGRNIQRIDTDQDNGHAAPAGLPVFATLPGGGNAYALRLLPPGDGSGGLLVADSNNVKQLDGSGAVVSTYAISGDGGLFSLNLDPDGAHFWVASFDTDNAYKIPLEAVAGDYSDTQVTTISAGSGGTVFGICLLGELTVGVPSGEAGRMTGGGRTSGTGGEKVTHGFTVQCDIENKASNLQVNWEGNRFHMESLDAANCSDNADYNEGNPIAMFDTFAGSGTGRLNKVSGATIEFTFTDQGEPGKTADTASIVIKDAGANVVLTVDGALNQGNHQAHPAKPEKEEEAE